MRHPADITPLTFLDYPKKAACIFWYTGCNLRCPYCYNPELVLSHGGGQDEMAFLRERAGFLDAVVLSGGESTLNPDIAEVCREIKKLGYLIKVDTNGSNPHVIRGLLEEKLTPGCPRIVGYGKYVLNARLLRKERNGIPSPLIYTEYSAAAILSYTYGQGRKPSDIIKNNLFITGQRTIGAYLPPHHVRIP